MEVDKEKQMTDTMKTNFLKEELKRFAPKTYICADETSLEAQVGNRLMAELNQTLPSDSYLSASWLSFQTFANQDISEQDKKVLEAGIQYFNENRERYQEVKENPTIEKIKEVGFANCGELATACVNALQEKGVNVWGCRFECEAPLSAWPHLIEQQEKILNMQEQLMSQKSLEESAEIQKRLTAERAKIAKLKDYLANGKDVSLLPHKDAPRLAHVFLFYAKEMSDSKNPFKTPNLFAFDLWSRKVMSAGDFIKDFQKPLDNKNLNLSMKSMQEDVPTAYYMINSENQAVQTDNKYQVLPQQRVNFGKDQR